MPEEIEENPRIYENILTSPAISNINVDEFHTNDYSYNTEISEELLSRDLDASMMIHDNDDETDDPMSIWRND